MVAGGLPGPNEAAEPEVRMRDEEKRGRGGPVGLPHRGSPTVGGGEEKKRRRRKKKNNNRPLPDNGREIIISTIGFEPMT